MPILPYREPASLPIEPKAPVSLEVALGRERSTHRTLPWKEHVRKQRSLAFVMVALFGGTLTAVGAPHLLDVALVLLGCGSLLALVFLGPAAFRTREQVVLHDRGLVMTRQGAERVLLFEDVDELWLSLDFGSASLVTFAGIHAVVLTTHDGRRFVLRSDLTDGGVLMMATLRACSSSLVPEARAALRRGDTLTFGRVTISSTRIAFGRRSAAWADLRCVRMLPGKIAFFRRQTVIPWVTVRLDRVPHPTLFARLVAETARKVETEVPLGYAGD